MKSLPIAHSENCVKVKLVKSKSNNEKQSLLRKMSHFHSYLVCCLCFKFSLVLFKISCVDYMICWYFYITTITLSDFPFASHHSFDSFNPLLSHWVHLGVRRTNQNTKTKLLIFVEILVMFILNQFQKMVTVCTRLILT